MRAPPFDIRPAYRVASRALGTLLMATLCAACAGSHQSPNDQLAAEMQAMQDAVPRYVHDPQRAAQLFATIHDLNADLVAFRSLLDRMHADLHALNARPDSTRADFEQVTDTYDTQRKTIRTRVLQRHRALIAATTADEWKDLARFERDALSISMQ